MSQLLIDTCRIDSVQAHPNADRLDLVTVKAWQCIVPRGSRKPGELITYIPPDSVLPPSLSDALGVTKYLSKGRVRANRLRGEPSFGVIMDAQGPEGFNAAESLGITKWEPPIRLTSGVSGGQPSCEIPEFPRYTDIENLRNYPDILDPGEEVVLTEKIHGTNSRIGFYTDAESGLLVRTMGSKRVNRQYEEGTTYHLPWTLKSVANLMASLVQDHKQAVLYGEIYGAVQWLKYGLPNGLGYAAFDLMLDNQYLDYDKFRVLMLKFEVPMVPSIRRGPFDMGMVKFCASGPSQVEGADNIREGVVIRPVLERSHPKIGRVCLKYVSDEYLLGPDHDEGE